MPILNKTQVDEMFKREAVLLGLAEGVPEFRAAALFGQDAVDFANKVNSGNRNGYGIGDFTLLYLNHKGFLAAASYYNVKQLKNAEDAAPAGETAELVSALLEKAGRKNQNNNGDLELIDLVMQGITQTDVWQAEQMQNPEIIAADKELQAKLDGLKGVVPEKLINQISDAASSYTAAFEYAAILYGIRVAEAIRDGAAHPSDRSQYVLNRIARRKRAAE